MSKSTNVSVVIPAYNAAGTIARALDSVFEQILTPVEVIVVDDGSTDQTRSVIRDYKYDVKYIKQENQGSAVARQAGSDEAQSEFIAYLDADDWWPKERIQNLFNILQSEPVCFLLGDFNRAQLTKEGYQYWPRNSSFFSWAEPIIKASENATGIADLYRLEQQIGLDLLLDGFPVYPSTMMVRKSALSAAGGWDARFRRCQDFDIGLKMAKEYPLYFCYRVSATLGIHDGNSDELDYLVKQTKGDILVLKAHEQDGTDHAYIAKVRRAIAKKYCGLGYVYRKKMLSREAISAYRSALQFPGRRAHCLLRLASLYLNLGFKINF